MYLAKNISLIPQSFFAESDEKVLDINTYTDIDRLTEVYVNPDRALYLFKDEHKLIGFVDTEFKYGIVFIAFAIAKSMRGKGYGRQMLEMFFGLPEVQGYIIEANADTQNSSSIKLLKKLNFEQAGTDEDGLARFRRAA